MVGFGFMDNLVMIFAGDLIDNTIGVRFGLATLVSVGFAARLPIPTERGRPADRRHKTRDRAAAFGQVFSDVSGVAFGGVVDSASSRASASRRRA